MLLLLAACATSKDVVTTRQDLATVRGDLEGFNSTVDRRQASMSEELLALKRELAALKSRDDIYRESFKRLQDELRVARTENAEGLRHLAALDREYQATQEEGISRRFDGLQAKVKELEGTLGALRRQLDESAAAETDQNRRLGETTARVNATLDAASDGNTRLEKGLEVVTGRFNELADKLNTVHKELAVLQKSFKAATSSHHVIAEGETLSTVAARYGIPVADLVRINGLANPNSIKVGQKILLSSP